MTTMRNICIITGTRAEYGLLSPVMKRIDEDSELKLQLLVTGSHLAEDLGYTYTEIEQDGFNIDGKIDIKLNDDSALGISESMSRAMKGFSEQFQIIKPDIVVLLGDRYEVFMAAAAATIAKIPIAHIHGGELTEGAYDDVFRHCITKMSSLHFPSTEEYQKRIIQLGEQPDKVFNVGALGVEIIKNMKIIPKSELEDQIGFQLNRNTLLATFHPVTLENRTSESQFRELLSAIDAMSGIKVIFTKANADTDGKIINIMIDDYVNRNPQKSIAFASMGQIRYLSAMRYCGAVIGNSSSGIIEAPSFQIPTINIGDRQKGRIQAQSIINCNPEKDEIVKALQLALSNRMSQRLHGANPYEGYKTHESIVNIIKEQILSNNIKLKKHFYDIKVD